jgi:hypothetical protein
MADGVLAPLLTAIPQTGLAANLPQTHPARPEHGLIVATVPLVGEVTDTQPITVRSMGRTGARAGSYFDDYYNRVHILPANIDLGAVADSTDRTTTLWNAYLGPSTLLAVPPPEDGVVISGITAPRIFKPLETVSVRATVNASGPATIDALFLFNFNTGDAVGLTVSGTRARLWPFAPNWRSPPEVEISYRTDIITSRSGREQRRALRATPRKRIGYTITVDRTDRQRLTQLLSTWQGRTMLMADPTRRVTLETGSPAAAGLMTVPEIPAWLAVDRQIMVGADLATVTEVDGETVAFEPANATTLLPGTIVRPALQGQLTGTLGAAHPTSRVAEARVNFALDPASELIDEGEASLYIHGGREVFTFRPNWAETLDQNFDWPVEQVDFGHGRIRTYQPIEMGWFTQSATFVGATPAEANDLEAFFHRMRGRRGEFFMPTGTDDITMRTTAAADTAFLRAVGTDLYDNYRNDTRYRAIAVRTRDGRLILRSIGSMYLVDDGLGSDTIIELTENWFFDLHPDEVATISWLSVFRFAADDVAFEWPASHVAQVKLAMRSLENLPAEKPLTGLDGAAQWVLEAWGPLYQFDDLDYAVNVRYPAIFWHALPWVMVNEAVVDAFDALVNEEYPDVFY